MSEKDASAPVDEPAKDAEASAAPPVTEPPSPDVAPVAEGSALPGEHRGGFARLPTAPVGIAAPVVDPASLPLPTLEWMLPDPPAPHRGLAAWALMFSIAGLVVSLFVGWGFPIGIVGIVTAILALRRPLESRRVAVWALVLGVVSVIYSAGWLLWAASRVDLLG
ncbi:hypothetical protein ASD65_15825 [Microbacterium sp. Root61]|uniref:hypothetical protein n=1 Tax=Microbacterium sp. Root61 TaxID=1736570 RepID=UPI0006FDA663|nr:hypothetical protein [Microbacterium sp. Root61]KRA25727.1 hypothetical protein ASD65_15825 [Microbacterium sp. Root61]